MAELADAQASGACGSNIVRVQVPLPAFLVLSGKRERPRKSVFIRFPRPFHVWNLRLDGRSWRGVQAGSGSIMHLPIPAYFAGIWFCARLLRRKNSTYIKKSTDGSRFRTLCLKRQAVQRTFFCDKTEVFQRKNKQIKEKTNKQSGEYKRCIEREKKSQKEVL